MTEAVLLSFSRREAQVLYHLCKGLSNAEIALELKISPPTVKFHLVRMYKKAGVSSRFRLIALALVSPGELDR